MKIKEDDLIECVEHGSTSIRKLIRMGHDGMLKEIIAGCGCKEIFIDDKGFSVPKASYKFSIRIHGGM